MKHGKLFFGTPCISVLWLQWVITCHRMSLLTICDVFQVTLVLFVGGYTMAEVAALRWLQTVTGHQIMVAGTGLTGGNKIISDMEKL